MSWYPLIAALAVMAVSLSGVLFSAEVLRAWVEKNLTYLATFAGGVFLLVVYHLLEETLHQSSSLALAAGSILFGAAVMQALHHMLPDTHHHHDALHDHAHSHLDGRRVLVSDGFHNVGDGVLLVATFAVSIPVGIAAAIGIVLHELVQEISEFFVLRGSGYSTQKALMLNFISSGTILVGVGVASFLASAENIAILFAGIAAGGFLTILVQDLIPNAIGSVKKYGGGWKHAVAAALGVALMIVVQMAFPHEEKLGDEETAVTPSHQTPSTRS